MWHCSWGKHEQVYVDTKYRSDDRSKEWYYQNLTGWTIEFIYYLYRSKGLLKGAKLTQWWSYHQSQLQHGWQLKIFRQISRLQRIFQDSSVSPSFSGQLAWSECLSTVLYSLEEKSLVYLVSFRRDLAAIYFLRSKLPCSKECIIS